MVQIRPNSKDFPANFKLIAIKTLPGCDKDYYKLLIPEKPYFFYNNYKIDSKTEKITYKSALSANSYNVNAINVNISANVEKNGSGKSTIIELLFRSIYNNISEFSNQKTT